jgi:hypothetical protein
VVIDQFNINRIISLEPKNDTPIGPHRYGPEALHVAFKRMEVVRGEAKVLRQQRVIQNGRNFLNRFREVGPNSATVIVFVEPFEAAMLKAPDY